MIEEKQFCTVTSNVQDTVISCAIPEQDDTLGNVLLYGLNSNPDVIVAAYRIPKPLQPSLFVRVQTRKNAKKCLQDTIQALCQEVTLIEEAFKDELSSKKK